MDAERELIDVCALATQIEDSDLCVGHTSVEARLRVWRGISDRVSIGRFQRLNESLAAQHFLIRADDEWREADGRRV